MSDSICHFMPAKNEEASIKTVRFVYETECRILTQPFVHPIYVFHVVTNGTSVLHIHDCNYPLKRGDVFFAFPALPYYLDADEDFEYIYISFMGTGAAALLSKCGVSPESPCRSDFSHICPLFENAIRRITPRNANLLTESMLYNALSYFDDGTSDEEDMPRRSENLFESIVNYVDHHYREKDMSLRRLADTFSYTETYLSSFFKKHMQTGFSAYLNHLRIQYATVLIEKGERNISKIATECGYNDYSYFAKVFKKNTGKTPTECIAFMNSGH